MHYIFAAVILVVTLTLTSNAEEKDIIPREIIFGNPIKDQPQISPDGAMLSYLAPSKSGVLNVWIKSLNKSDDRMITNDENKESIITPGLTTALRCCTFKTDSVMRMNIFFP